MKKLIVILAAVALVAAFAVTTMAAEWSFYGNARMGTWRTNNDVKDSDGVEADDEDTTWNLHNNARVGAKVKVDDKIGAMVEYGSKSTESVYLRHLYGTYNFGAGEILIGQTWTPAMHFYSNSVYKDDGDLLGMGQFYVGRQPMIKLKMGGFEVALINPSKQAITSAEEVGGDIQFTTAFSGEDIDVDIPKIEANYVYRTDTFFVEGFAGYQTYTVDAVDDPATAANDPKEWDVDSYVVGIGGGMNFGPGYFKAGVHMGENLGNYGASGFINPYNGGFAVTGDVGAGTINYAGAAHVDDQLIDSEALGYLAVLGFKIDDMFTVEAGYGYQEYEFDVSGSPDVNAQQYYLNCSITIAPGFFVVPEIGKVEYEAFDDDYGDFIYFGAKWQINF